MKFWSKYKTFRSQNAPKNLVLEIAAILSRERWIKENDEVTMSGMSMAELIKANQLELKWPILLGYNLLNKHNPETDYTKWGLVSRIRY